MKSYGTRNPKRVKRVPFTIIMYAAGLTEMGAAEGLVYFGRHLSYLGELGWRKCPHQIQVPA